MPHQKKYSLEIIQRICSEKSGVCISTEYAGIHSYLEIKCEKSHVFHIRGDHLIHDGQWCKYCMADRFRVYHNINHDFFSKDTEESFYWAGFLAADGWKTGKAQGWGESNYTVGITLAKKDVHHLEKLRNILSPEYNFYYRERKSPGSDEMCFSYTLIIHSKQMYKDLERFNVIERKTYFLDIPEWIKTHPLLNHYLRGYLDGDGCFGTTKNKGNELNHIYFCMPATQEFLTSFNGILEREGVVKRKHIFIKKTGKKWLAFDKVRYSGNVICSKLFDYLYNDATIYLERKYEIAKQAKDLARHGTDKKKRLKKTSKTSPELLLELARRFNTGKEVADYLKCTPANISAAIRSFDIKDKFYDLLKNKNAA